MSKKNWGMDAPLIPEVIPDEVRPQRAKKDTRKWCRGKVGLKHRPEVVINHTAISQQCQWVEYKVWQTGEVVRRWQCRHSIRCSGCSKYLHYFMRAEDCPTYREQES